MNAVLERARAHYETLPGGSMQVPEWGEPGKPLCITWKVPTLHQRRAIFRPGKDGIAPDGVTVCVRAVISAACDEQGKRLFSEMDEAALLHSVDPKVIQRIGLAIMDMEGEAEDMVQAAKND